MEKIDPLKLIEKISKEWEISDDTQSTIFSNLSSPRPPPREAAGRTSPVAISAVSTFVARKSFLNFAVPPFAAHWGVVIEFNELSKILFHLLFDVDASEVKLALTAWDSKLSKHDVKRVGTTLYGASEIHKIGNDYPFLAQSAGLQLLHAFQDLGSYHFIFWNCQVYAKLFLKIICQNSENSNFATLTSADVTRYVPQFYAINADTQALCAIVIPSPIATTQWYRELQRTRELLERIQQSDNKTDDQPVVIADQGVNYIVYSSLTDPKNEEQIVKELAQQGGGRCISY